MAFHYRTICCSRACAQIYLERVQKARKAAKEQVVEPSNDASVEVEEVKVDLENKQEEVSEDTQTSETKIDDVTEQPVKRKYTRKRQTDAESVQIE